jgi:2,5-furandicarboxylate decarboxylase 1
MVIEGEILPAERTAEGPFGEFTGYSLGERQREVLRVKAITHRAGAMFQDITVAHLDHMLLSTIPMEANLYRAVRAMVPSVRAVRVPGPFTCYVSIEQRLVGQAKNALLAAFGADLYMKRVVVVDHDVDVFDDRQMTWAIATRCQPDRDITVITNARGSDLDPSTREDGYSAKWGVDATAKPSLASYTPRHRVPPEVYRRLDLEAFDL